MAQARREKAAREHRDIQQLDVANAVGVGKASVSRYENDVDTPREATLAKIAAYLDTTPQFLRYGVGPADAPPGMTHHPTMGDIPLDKLRPVPEPVAKPRRKTAGKRDPK